MGVEVKKKPFLEGVGINGKRFKKMWTKCAGHKLSVSRWVDPIKKRDSTSGDYVF